MLQLLDKKMVNIVIVGRTNVGKSTLFNRLIGKRRAITDSMPGVTRDPVESKWELNGQIVRLIDTGGFSLNGSTLDRAVKEKAYKMIDTADLIMLVLDCNEFTPEDESFVETLRPHSERVILVVNKVDNPERETGIWNFLSTGFPVVGVSAIHGKNIERLVEEVKQRIAHIADGSGREWRTEEREARFAILGKPNTGKSTLLNRLTSSVMAIVDENPGTTRDIIEGRFFYKDRFFTIYDTAGIRRKKRVKESVEYYSVNRAIKAIDFADVIFLLIDAQGDLTQQDKKIAEQVVKKGKGIVLVLNKWDKLEKIPNLFRAVKDRIRFLFPVLSFAPVVRISALTGYGVEKLLETGLKLWKQLNLRINTGRLNKMLAKWKSNYSPPSTRRFIYKIRYITQVSSNPVVFVAFVNRKKGFPQAYIDYIKNRIREELGFSLIPISIELRESGIW